MKPIRYEYGTPRYQIAPGVESPQPMTADELATMPPLPTEPGYYILSSDWGWVLTDGLTYRTWAWTIKVTES